MSLPTSGRCASSMSLRVIRGPQERALPLALDHRSRRDGDRVRRGRLRLRRHRRPVARRTARRARARARVGARHARATRSSIRARCRVPAPRGEYASPALERRRCHRAANGSTCCRRNRARPAIDPRIVDWEASVEVRARDAAARHQRRAATCVQRYRFLMPVGQRHRACRRRHADAHRSTATAASASRAAIEILARFGFAGGARRVADEALELLAAPNCPSRRDGRAAHARPDDAADPRVDRPSARARPHPRRRAQLRRHELRHARHVRHATATARDAAQRHVRPDARPRSSRATPSTTTARPPSKPCT